MNVLEQDIARQIGLNIKVVRTRRRLSQQELADAMNSKASYLSEIETGKHNISLVMMIRLCEALACQLTELFEGVEIKVRKPSRQV